MKLVLKFGQYIVLALFLLLVIIVFKEKNFLNEKSATDAVIIKSAIDYDEDGIDDYTDILDGAKEFVDKKPKYKSKYYDGGYPDDDYYVCTDVIWYALKNAGYDFKSMIDLDIKENKKDYDIDVIDSNIDFRRVKNIKVFLDKYTLSLTTDGEESDEFNPGDIVVYKNHIAVVGDKLNKDNVYYIIHHDGVHNYIDNGLMRNTIVGHYRFILNEDYENLISLTK